MLSYQLNSKLSTKLSLRLTNPQKMARKKERLISSFALEDVPILRLKGFLSNTIINIKLKIMNKKFSTLVAGLLLAASFGTVDAQYTMYGAGQTSSAAVKTLKKEGAFQLSDGAGKVLAMVKDANGKYSLKMVAADGTVKLAETLWTIRWTTSSDTNKKYYFTFQSAAYNMPLSFSTENAGKGSLSASVNYEFPGKIATWEWQDGIESNAGFSTAVDLKYRFNNPDSVMTLATNSNGLVGVIKYAQKEGTSVALKLQPKALDGVILSAADLNSKMLTQNVSELLKLTFNADVTKGSTNLWTSSYEATQAIGENEINKAVVKVINDAVAAVDRASKGGAIADAIREVKADYEDAGDIAIVEAVAAAAEAAADPAAAKTAAAAKLAEYTTVKTNAGHAETYAKAIQTAYGATLKQGTVSPNTIAAYKAAVQAINETNGLDAEVVAAIQDAFIALVPGDDADAYVQPSASAVTAAVNEYTKALETATAEEAVATAANAEGAALTVDHTYISGLITGMKADVIDDAGDALDALDGKAITSLDVAVKGVKEEAPKQIELYPAIYKNYVSLYVPKSTNPNKYLRVDTTFLTGSRGSKHLAFMTGKFDNALKNSKGKLVDTYVQHDYNARYDFRFTYFPTEDSLVINTPLEDNSKGIYRSAGFAHPLADVKYLDMSNKQIEDSWTLHTVKVQGQDTPENIVKIVVLNDVTNHREVTIGADEVVEATNADPKTTLNTRIGFNVKFPESYAIPAGVYTIKYISNETWNKDLNGRYITYNWLANDYQVMASVENQELNHMPAAQWIVTQAKGENLNSIVNRESAQPLSYSNEFGQVQQQYMYKTGTKDWYTNMNGDTLMFTKVPDEFVKDVTLGYFIDPEKNKEADDQLRVFSLKYLNDLNDDLFVGYNEADSLLNVAKTDEDSRMYFRLVRATDSVTYGASAAGIAPELKHIAYYLQLETANKNIKETDKLYITKSEDGKYKLQTIEQAAKQPFFLKEFKEDNAHYYALIEAGRWVNGTWNSTILGNEKISVKDYPSILVEENLEGENRPVVGEGWGYLANGRTSTFGLVAKDAPKYRRLGVTNPDDELTNMGTNVAKINVTREANRYLYENTANSVAGYESDPTGINYLGALFNGADKAAMFIDTAYVRNETARPQYLLALRPDFTPDTTFCPVDHGHPYELVDQVRASYLVTLSDSVAAYTDKTIKDKFMYENRTYTRLAFVDAVHQGDLLVIKNSKFTGTKEAKNDTIDLSKNGFNNAAVQFRLTKNDDQTAEFYIETQHNEFVRLINGVAVLTNDIADAERFNIAKTDDKPVANEGINTSEVSVVATNGAVIVKGAAGKTVTISNVLGQKIANTVLSSDEAAISAPAGIVVVAVEGEAVVKAIVK